MLKNGIKNLFKSQKNKNIIYPDYWKNKNPEKWDYLNHNLKFPDNNYDNYELLNQIGKGGYSMIYNAYDIFKNKEVTIKILNHERIQKIRREIMVLNHINQKSEYLPNILDYGIESSTCTYFLV